MTGFFGVKGWEKFQHYKDRHPPWIKFHNSVLDDYALGLLPDASKAHLFAIWLLASRYDNKIPFDSSWVGTRINATTPVDLIALAKSGFIELDEACSNLLADRKQNACLEREGEKIVSKIQASPDADASKPPENLPAGEQKPEAPPMSLKDQIFGPCLIWLETKAHLKPARARAMIGKWLRDFGEGATLEAMNAAAKESAIEPIAFINGRLAKRATGGNRQGAGSIVDAVNRAIEADLERQAHDDGMGRGGDRVRSAGDEAGDFEARYGTNAEAIDADDADELFKTYGRFEALDRKSRRTGKRSAGADDAVRGTAAGLPGGRDEPRADDTSRDQQMVASVGGSVGASGALQPQTVAVARSVAESEDDLDLPDFLDQRPKKFPGETDADLLRRILGDGPNAKRTIET